jgi:hypothetical protein
MGPRLQLSSNWPFTAIDVVDGDLTMGTGQFIDHIHHSLTDRTTGGKNFDFSFF